MTSKRITRRPPAAAAPRRISTLTIRTASGEALSATGASLEAALRRLAAEAEERSGSPERAA